jgi:hypothetical protein
MKLNKIILFVLAGFLTGCGLGPLSYTNNADNNQVITLGDSIFDLSDQLQSNLEDYAGQSFRKYALNGAKLAETSKLIYSVVDQYAHAKEHNADISTIIMDGGGNDILVPAFMKFDPYRCKTHWYQFGQLSDKCKVLIDDLYVDGVNLLNEMDNDGVDNIIYLGYYYPKDGLFLSLKSLKQAVDYGNDNLSRACENSSADCVFVDPRALIVNSDIAIDSIHPTRSGSRKLADLIWPHLEPILLSSNQKNPLLDLMFIN